MTEKANKKSKPITQDNQALVDLLCLSQLFSTYYTKSGNTEVALQNSTHMLGILKQVCKL